MHTIFIISGLVTLIGLVGVLLWRTIEIKRGGNFQVEQGLMTLVEPKVDKLAYYVSASVVIAFKQFKILLILALAKLIGLMRVVIVRLEKRFSKIVNQVKGKGEINQRGSVSLFLRQVKEHQDQIRSEAQGGLS